jgi:adenine/guanine phosphoribosyltransferase-like PRPP-binding protein
VLFVDDLVATGGTLNAGVRGCQGVCNIEAILCVLKVEALEEAYKKLLAPFEVITLL